MEGISYLKGFPLTEQEHYANYDSQLRYEVDQCEWWKSLLARDGKKMAEFHEKLTEKEFELMELTEAMKGDWTCCFDCGDREFKNESAYLEICRNCKYFYEKRKKYVEAEEVIFKEDVEREDFWKDFVDWTKDEQEAYLTRLRSIRNR